MKLLEAIVDGLTGFLVKLSVFLTAFSVNAGQAGYFNQTIPTGIQSETMRSVGTPSINDAHVDLFANNVYHVSQQQGSILMPFVLVEGMVMNSQQISRLGSLGMPSLYTGRGSKVTATNPANDVRWLTAQRYWHACFVDKWDQIRTLWDISNAYSQAMAMSFGRLQDRVIIAAALGSVWTGPTKQNKVELPSTQKIFATSGVATGTEDGAGANLALLQNVRKKMKQTFATKRGETIVMVITAEEVNSFLEEAKMTSRDYTTILALMQGEISAFFGFLFAETQLVPRTSEDLYYRRADGVSQTMAEATGQLGAGGTHAKIDSGKGLRCFAFMSGSSICFGINQNLMVRVSERADLHYNIQIYYAMEIGATRKEEVKVVEVITKDTTA